MIAVLEQSTGREYRARSNYINRPELHLGTTGRRCRTSPARIP